jgi:hypothetical protein
VPTRRATTLAAAVATGLALTSCGVAGPVPRTLVGPVTAVDATGVCVGGPDASGDCFLATPVTQALHVGDCVRVTYVVTAAPGRVSATTLEGVEPGDDSASSSCNLWRPRLR